jgi:hypothetical protein
MINIFKTKVEMPPKDNSSDVVRTALSFPEVLKDHTPAVVHNPDAGVRNVQRPRRGHGY